LRKHSNPVLNDGPSFSQTYVTKNTVVVPNSLLYLQKAFSKIYQKHAAWLCLPMFWLSVDHENDKYSEQCSSNLHAPFLKT